MASRRKWSGKVAPSEMEKAASPASAKSEPPGVEPAVGDAGAVKEEGQLDVFKNSGVWHWLGGAARVHGDKVGSIDVTEARGGHRAARVYSYGEISSRAAALSPQRQQRGDGGNLVLPHRRAWSPAVDGCC